MRVLLVLGYGHPGQGMGDDEGSCHNWLRYIQRIAELAENVDICILAGGPILSRAGSEAEAMYRWLCNHHARITPQISFILETQSLVTFENFEFSEQLLRGYPPVTELTILGAHHKQMGCFFLGTRFFPSVAFTGRLRVETYMLKSEREWWEDGVSVIRYMVCLLPGLGPLVLKRIVRERIQVLLREGKRPPENRYLPG